jgi:hypothetical protein
MEIIKSIQLRIYEIRGVRVILDYDLAVLYESETRLLNEAVKRNIRRFPSDFMFRLTKEEVQSLGLQENIEDPRRLISHFAISNNQNLSSKTKNITSGRGGNRHLPFAFTEQGVAMLSGILNSEKAIAMNIAIMRAFVDIWKLLITNGRKEKGSGLKKLEVTNCDLKPLYQS